MWGLGYIRAISTCIRIFILRWRREAKWGFERRREWDVKSPGSLVLSITHHLPPPDVTIQIQFPNFIQLLHTPLPNKRWRDGDKVTPSLLKTYNRCADYSKFIPESDRVEMLRFLHCGPPIDHDPPLWFQYTSLISLSVIQTKLPLLLPALWRRLSLLTSLSHLPLLIHPLSRIPLSIPTL